jgi:hypothetical protein
VSPPDTPANYLELIGSIAVACRHIEMNTALLAATLIDPEGDVGHAVVANEPFARVCRLIGQVKPKRLTDKVLSERIDHAVTAAETVMRNRHDIMRSTWMVSGDTADRTANDPGTLGLDDLVTEARRARETAVLTGECWISLSMFYGRADDLATATEAQLEAEGDASHLDRG